MTPNKNKIVAIATGRVKCFLLTPTFYKVLSGVCTLSCKSMRQRISENTVAVRRVIRGSEPSTEPAKLLIKGVLGAKDVQIGQSDA